MTDRFIPTQLWNEDFRFLKIRKKGKEPTADMGGWQEKNFKYNDTELLNYLITGGNYAIIGGFGNLILIDSDSKEINELCKTLPETFTIKTGSPEEYKKHYYFITDTQMKAVRLSKEHVGDLGDIRSVGQYVVAPTSIHPSGGEYKVIKDIPIAKVSEKFVRSIFKEYIDQTESTEFKEFPIETKKRSSDFIRICNVPDYCINNKLKGGTSKNWKLFPYLVDILHNREVAQSVYIALCKKQGHSIGAIKGWVKKAHEGKLAKTSCEKMQDYLNRFHPDLINNICGKCLLSKHKEDKEPTKESLEILEDKNLFDLIIKEFDKKIEGEEKSKKAIFLSLCNIWEEGSEIPLNTFVSSESSAGKSFICRRIVKIFPKELVVYRTKITPEAFTYWHNEDDWNWDGKICYLEDVSQQILDAPTFKVMCSEGSTATIVIKQKAVDIEIRGKPVMLITTASTNPKTEILGRFQIVSLDESKEQTEAIIFRQAEDKEEESYDENIINALRLLKRKKVKVPFGRKIAQYLKENYNFKSLRLRRDFSRLLDLIKCSAVLYQCQRREINSNIIEANEQDYKIARECINYIQTQTFKGLTHKLKKAFDCCKELREFTAKEIHSKFPFVNQKMWYIYLDKLLERNMLKTELRKIEDIKQRVTFYIINEDKSFELPEFDNLPKDITNVTIDTKLTKVTSVTKVKKQL